MKMNVKENMHEVGMELIKVVYMFSLAAEILSCVIGAYYKHSGNTPYIMLLLLVPVVSVLLRRCVKNFILFFLVHVAMFAAIFLYPNILIRVAAGAFIAADIIYIYVRKTSGTDDPMSTIQLVVAFAVALIMYFTAGQMEFAFMRPFIIGMFIVHISAYMVYYHQLNVRFALEANAGNLNQSTKKLGSINNKIITFYVGIMLLLIILGVVLRMDVVFTMIGQMLLLLVRVIVQFLFRGDGQDSDVIVDTQEEAIGGGGDGPTGEFVTYEFWLILEKFVIAACAIAAVIGLIYLAYHFYQKFMRNRIEENQTSEFEETTIFVEKTEKVRKERKSLFDYFNLTNEKKVRRIYAKKIQKQIKAGVSVKPSQTVQEIRKMVDKENLSHITTLYEKARYSDQPISREEVKSIE